ncbi:hypothetical protein B9N43_16185 [Denitratisoma sp. DHT3]|uniref:MaoC family dehydratase n=1 Tax=Denitratisoma sp. DHT3 TaxID=1981880 RepID=UPI0011987DA1|nr:MaoC/PaaZ C-terminal domain-containing protein [Denitratisoma sp. DHT3]QDX82635.1 hypothetical protein B9N43_16185 [Denitratisoma sp. DHT3]
MNPSSFLLHADYPEALSGETTPRSVGAHDIVTFGCLTGDYNRFHMDDHYGASLPYGSRIAHGLLSASLALGGLAQDAPLAVGRRHGGAYLSHFEVNYRQPVFPGDTLRTRWSLAKQADAGEAFAPVRTGFDVLNHKDQVVSDGHLLLQLPTATAVRHAPPPGPAAWPGAYFDPEPGRVYFLEDFQPGSHAGETEGRTLTEADVIHYGGFTGDNGGHAGDAEFARQGLFGARIVQPLLAFEIGFALWLKDWCRMGTPDSGLAGHLCDRWTFHAPFRIGDTLRCRYRTLSARASNSRPEMGLLICGLQMINQRDEVNLAAEVVMMYPARKV